MRYAVNWTVSGNPTHRGDTTGKWKPACGSSVAYLAVVLEVRYPGPKRLRCVAFHQYVNEQRAKACTSETQLRCWYLTVLVCTV